MTSPLLLDSVYGPGASVRVREARVLVVGAGGVGCELVKNLALAGFASITLIDLDTIDVSNLNRQFLFRRKHVGKPKATEAAASIRAMIPSTNIDGIMANIKEARFDVVFFKQFALVCNALDNLEARRHVNRMALAASVPLVESGSTGYNGQCSVIGNGVECYDCVDRPPQKSYAVCTIRSTPEKPVHCIVWAKFLYELIFGADDDGNVLKDLDSGPSSETQPNGLNHTSSESREEERAATTIEHSHELNSKTNDASIAQPNGARESPKRRRVQKRVRCHESDTAMSFSERVCHRVFVDDINDQLAMKDLWVDRAPPLVFDVNMAADATPVALDDVDILEQRVWSKETSASVFKGVLQRIVETRREEIGSLSFDKDDRDAMMFVASAANLRAHAYGVPLQSPFSVKGIAGNIVHAVATTNAMVGGLIVLEALKIATADGDLSKNLTTYVSQAPRGSRAMKILCPAALQKPNPKCYVCSEGQLHLSVDVDKMSLQILVSCVLQKKMSIIHPGIHVTTGEYHNTVYESGDGLEEDEIEVYTGNLSRLLRSLRVESGSQLVIEDFAQNLRCTIHVTHVENLMEDQALQERFILDGDVPSQGRDDKAEEKADSGTEDLDDGLEEASMATSVKQSTSKDAKRKRALEDIVEENGGLEPKRRRAASEG